MRPVLAHGKHETRQVAPCRQLVSDAAAGASRAAGALEGCLSSFARRGLLPPHLHREQQQQQQKQQHWFLLLIFQLAVLFAVLLLSSCSCCLPCLLCPLPWLDSPCQNKGRRGGKKRKEKRKKKLHKPQTTTTKQQQQSVLSCFGKVRCYSFVWRVSWYEFVLVVFLECSCRFWVALSCKICAR